MNLGGCGTQTFRPEHLLWGPWGRAQLLCRFLKQQQHIPKPSLCARNRFPSSLNACIHVWLSEQPAFHRCGNEDPESFPWLPFVHPLSTNCFSQGRQATILCALLPGLRLGYAFLGHHPRLPKSTVPLALWLPGGPARLTLTFLALLSPPTHAGLTPDNEPELW